MCIIHKASRSVVILNRLQLAARALQQRCIAVFWGGFVFLLVPHWNDVTGKQRFYWMEEEDDSSVKSRMIEKDLLKTKMNDSKQTNKKKEN